MMKDLVWEMDSDAGGRSVRRQEGWHTTLHLVIMTCLPCLEALVQQIMSGFFDIHV